MYIAIALLIFIAVYALLAVWAERKVSAWIQDRMGPVEHGPWGLFQTFLDILKMMGKENIVPTVADKILFFIAPITIFVSVYMGFACLPIAQGTFVAGSSLGIFYTITIIAIEVPGILMAGWAANNKYALLGAFRSVAQSISYEIPSALAIVATLLVAGSLDLSIIAQNQGIMSNEPIYFLGIFSINKIGGLLAWNIFQAPHLIIAFVIFFIASLAQCNRAPFDLPEAESEIIAGFHTEYSGFRFGVIFLAEYGMMMLLSTLAVTLFLGAWYSPLPNIGNIELANYTNGTFWGIFWLLSKALLLVFLQMWIRWTFPRFRLDQLMKLCWQYLIPIALVCIFISSIYLVLVKK